MFNVATVPFWLVEADAFTTFCFANSSTYEIAKVTNTAKGRSHHLKF